MKSYRFRILNVFTRGSEPFSGNPLCVFENAVGMDADTMQSVARQFNLSESTFIFPADTAGVTANVRIYTPAYEMAFAGHPTLGTAYVCRALRLGGDTLQLKMPAGIIPVVAAKDRWTLTSNVATFRELNEPRAMLASALGLQETDIGDRPLWIDSGSEQLIVPLTSEAAVRKAQPRAEILSQIKSNIGHGMAYVFHVGKDGKALSRFFFPQDAAMLEDPATGSATANFGGWWLAMQKPLPMSLQIAQGEYCMRPSALYLNIDAQRQVTVSGNVVEVGQGSFEV